MSAATAGGESRFLKLAASALRAATADRNVHFWVVLVSLLAAGSPALADPMRVNGWGVRGGLSSDPDQLVLGVHMGLSEPAENLRLVPNVDIGFGDDLTVFTINGDVVYDVPVEDAGAFYFGGSLGLVHWRADDITYRDNNHVITRDGHDDTDLGLAAIIGWTMPVSGNPVRLDLKLGITDEYPELKFLVTYTFLR